MISVASKAESKMMVKETRRFDNLDIEVTIHQSHGSSEIIDLCRHQRQFVTMLAKDVS